MGASWHSAAMNSTKLSLLSFNFRLIAATFLLVVVIATSLVLVAQETGNWHGAWISLAHVIVVALGTYYAVRRDQ